MFPESQVINLEEECLVVWMRQLLLRWLRLDSGVHSGSHTAFGVRGGNEEGGDQCFFSELEGLGKH